MCPALSFSRHPPGILATLHVLGQGLQTRQGRSLLCLSHRSAETNRGKTGIRQIWSYSRPGGSRIWSAWRGVKIMFVVPGNLWEFSCWELDPEPFMLMETYVPSLLLGAPWGLAASLALPGNICSAGCALGAQERPNPKGIRPSQQGGGKKDPLWVLKVNSLRMSVHTHRGDRSELILAVLGGFH